MKARYKIHGYNTVFEKGVTCANTNKFYDTMEEAIEAAKACLRRPHNQDSGIVITKTVALVQLATPPIEIVAIGDTSDGLHNNEE